jgi:antitoxin (DNA-binding transcriptional repressor) of toxin-antitoxin stability system
MKQVSIQELKRSLSALIREASLGQRILVLRHHRPVAAITPPRVESTTVGTRFGAGALRPLLRRATRGRFLTVLAEDRRGDPDGR